MNEEPFCAKRNPFKVPDWIRIKNSRHSALNSIFVDQRWISGIISGIKMIERKLIAICKLIIHEANKK